MDVLRLVRGKADLQHVRHVGVVHAARRDVGGEHDQVSALSELLGDTRALRLRFARVHLEHRDPERDEELGVELREPRGCEEDDNLVLVLFRELAYEVEELGGERGRLRDDGALRHVRVRLLVGADGVDELRVTRRDARNLQHVGGERGREEERLSRATRRLERAEDARHVRPEAHLQQLVGFVKDEYEKRSERHAGAVIGEEIVEAAGRGDQHGGRRASADGARVGGHVGATEHCERAQRRLVEGEQHLAFGADLRGELAGGRDGEGEDAGAGGALGLGVEDPLDSRQQEANRLAGAGLRLGNNVLARQRDRQRLLLHGGKKLVLHHLGDGSARQRRDGQLAETVSRHVSASGRARAAGDVRSGSGGMRRAIAAAAARLHRRLRAVLLRLTAS
mmetsp:Transcript_25842/g.54183  ORF Transcript_25842/g.54183 Transcript_25842/m.54183 type:complete len:394 (-) Transcript_25842:97-1278(-)